MTRADDATLQVHLQALMAASQQAFALFDDTDTLRYANQAFRALFGLAPDGYPTWAAMMRGSFERRQGSRVEAADFEKWLRSAQSRRGKLPYRTIESDMVDGRWILTTETTLPDGWMLCVLTDVSELGQDWRTLRVERDQARKAALSDELTGVSNRRYAQDYLDRLLGPHKAVGLAAVMLDIDHFKRINDTWGHDVGDQVLRHFAALLQAQVRRDDVVARLGGEEFVLLLPGLLRDQVGGLLARLLDALRAARPLADRPDLAYTCSAGVALVRPGEGAEALLRRADQALYVAKRGGRDRYVFCDAVA